MIFRKLYDIICIKNVKIIMSFLKIFNTNIYIINYKLIFKYNLRL